MADGSPRLVFFPETHAYTLDGRAVPGVTRVLKPISEADYWGADPDVMAAKAELGRAVHRLIELDCQGVLLVDALDPRLVPYLRAWRDFLKTSGFEPLASEMRVFSSRYHYAGQLDVFGRINGLLAVIDAKCVAAIMRSTGPQTMGYRDALAECRPDLLPAAAPCHRYALQLHPGRGLGYSLHPFRDDGGDRRAFLACLTLYHYLHRTANA